MFKYTKIAWSNTEALFYQTITIGSFFFVQAGFIMYYSKASIKELRIPTVKNTYQRVWFNGNAKSIVPEEKKPLKKFIFYKSSDE